MNPTAHLLETSRTRLLDLTLRNALLNYRLTKKRRITIVDQLPDILYRRLMDGETIDAVPVPFQPDAKPGEKKSIAEYARSLTLRVDETPTDYATRAFADRTGQPMQMLHYPDTLERLMREFRSDANAAILETGSNLLYLAVGFLQWRAAPDKIVHAPLILLPIQIEKHPEPDPQTGRYVYGIRYTEEDLFSNLSLQYKIRQDFGIVLPEFDESQSPEGYFEKISAICAHHNDLLGVERCFALDFFHFNKLLMYLDLDPENWPPSHTPQEHGVLAALSGAGSETAPLNQTDPDASEALPLVLDADGSQRDAIIQVLHGHHLIIEGPPGTGKSQTIANLIAAALGEGKTVLFVAEKLVALEVVKRRLDAAGLGEFVLELHSHKSSRADFYAALKERLELELSASQADPRGHREQIDGIKAEVSAYLDALHTPHATVELTPYRVFGEMLSRQEAALEALPSDPVYLQISREQLEALQIDLNALTRAIDADPTLLDSPWRGLTATEAIAIDATAIITLIEKIRNEYARIVLAFETHVPEAPRDMAVLTALQEVVEAGMLSKPADRQPLRAIATYDDAALETMLCKNEEMLRSGELFERIDLGAFAELPELDELARTLRGFREIGFFGKLFNRRYKEARRRFHSFYFQAAKLSAIEMSETLINDRAAIERYVRELKRFYEKGGQQLLQTLEYDPVDPDHLTALPAATQQLRSVSALRSAAQWRRGLAEAGLPDVMITPFAEDPKAQADRLLALHYETETAMDAIAKVREDLARYGTLDEPLFYRESTDVPERVSLLDTKLAAGSALGSWIDFSRLLGTVEAAGLGGVITFAREQGMAHRIRELTAFGYYREWAHAMLRETPLLAEFSRERIETRLQQFRELDAALGALHAEAHAERLFENRTESGVNGKVAEKTEMYLLRNEIGKQRRHQPIREALRRAPRSIRALKPCFMMSPLSVAQFVGADQEPFDLMIMDEASQIFPEDALGAIARAKQTVVVGDPNQLPPTGFFTSAMHEDDDAMMADFEKAESILDLMLRTMPAVRRLTWHYRSRHESLIAFSNHHFYGGELRIFPSPEAANAGISRVFVAEGFFDDQLNRKEADVMVEAICGHLQNAPGESLGVAVMNKRQSERIEEQLEKRGKGDPALREMINDAYAQQRLFIKNLENVQGDEADTLFIGTTYGPDPKSRKVYQRFGPINGETGWRRINVLVTRARRRIVLFTSMQSSDLTESETNRGKMALKHYLEYAETGKVGTACELESAQAAGPFEAAVAAYVTSLGYEVVPRVGVAGFFIDLGVKTPDGERFILGIECDGEAYHAETSYRDRDRTRPTVLTHLGWKIHRVWSAAWFKHPEAERERLKGVLEDGGGVE